MPEFLEPQKFSLVKLFCPILLIKFYFISPQAQLTQIFSTLPQNPRKSGAPHQTCAPLAVPLIFSRSLIFSPNPHNHTPSHRSHKNFVGFAHLNPRKTMSDLHIPHRIRTQFEIAGVFGRQIRHSHEFINFSGRICTLPKILSDLHIHPHVTPVEQCRICTKAQGNCPALNTNDNKNHSHLKSGMRMIIIRI